MSVVSISERVSCVISLEMSPKHYRSLYGRSSSEAKRKKAQRSEESADAREARLTSNRMQTALTRAHALVVEIHYPMDENRLRTSRNSVSFTFQVYFQYFCAFPFPRTCMYRFEVLELAHRKYHRILPLVFHFL